MAKPSIPLINALRKTSAHLLQSPHYQWGHMGSCNCGFLAQQITGLGKSEIHKFAMQGYGDWSEQLNDYCPNSGLSMDVIITTLLDVGFDIDDLKHLERLSDFSVLTTLPQEESRLRYNVKDDVVKYLNAWASCLETPCVEDVQLPTFDRSPVFESSPAEV